MALTKPLFPAVRRPRDPVLQEKCLAWRQRFEEVFGDIDLRSNRPEQERAIEAAAPGFATACRGLVSRFVGVAAALKVGQVLEAVPENPAYEAAFAKAIAFSQEVTAAVLAGGMAKAEFNVIVGEAYRYASHHADPGMAGVLRTIEAMAETAQGHFYPAAAPTGPAGPK